jgi:hypothetical protein
MVKKGIVLTPHADYCLPGITRATVSLIIFQLEILGTILQKWFPPIEMACSKT